MMSVRAHRRALLARWTCPGLYVSRANEYFWSTVPYLARDQKRVEDVDSSGPDHGADAVRYGCLREAPVFELSMGIGGLRGVY